MARLKISIIGVGYVGLCTAVGFADKGFKVMVSDYDLQKAEMIQAGTPPFYEPQLPELLNHALVTGRLQCMFKDTEKSVLETDVSFICVGTPSNSDGSIDLQYIESASREIGQALRQKAGYHLVVIKSTVIPGTTCGPIKNLLEQESGKVCGADFGLCMNPEFLRQGFAFEGTFRPDRLVIGEYDTKSGDVLENVYKTFYSKMPTTIRTTLSTAELIKYASNSLLATRISYINMIANICENIPDTDVRVVASAMGLDRRIGPLFLDAGLGYGGSCFPKDIKALIASARTFGYEPELLQSVENVNKNQPLRAVEFCRRQFGTLKGRKVAILGLAFKPDTDDMREARVIPIINKILAEGGQVIAYDPVAVERARAIFESSIEYASSAIECIRGADCCILVTEWAEFRKLTPDDFVRNMRQPVLFDGRRIFDPSIFGKALKFKAIGLGP